jgi:type IV secretory pathway protease TraF
MSAIAPAAACADARRMRSCNLVIAACALALAGLALAASNGGAPVLIYNASPSAPVGFYLRDQRAPAPGMFVTVRAAAVAPAYARLRGFDDPTDRFIKRIAADAGVRVCAEGDSVRVGAELVLPRQARDSSGRALPAWSECRMLRQGEIFLLGQTADSFDSRYWGPVSVDIIDGVWRPLGRVTLLHTGDHET